jgi:hypothetical protein
MEKRIGKVINTLKAVKVVIRSYSSNLLDETDRIMVVKSEVAARPDDVKKKALKYLGIPLLELQIIESLEEERLQNLMVADCERREAMSSTQSKPSYYFTLSFLCYNCSTRTRNLTVLYYLFVRRETICKVCLEVCL